ncbi:MAG: arylesterase [Bacteroidetes bacterium]|nr:arylesterase [Bacteroidota bacterium]
MSTSSRYLWIVLGFLFGLNTLASGYQNSPQPAPKTILFFGDSITAGYGLDPSLAFPALIQNKIDEKALAYKVINAGLSGETSAGGLRRVDWVLQQEVDIFVLELGGNDGLRGLDLDQTKSNLQGIIDKVNARYPQATLILAGMEVPPNLGVDYRNRFREMYQQLAQENELVFIPFILDGVGGIPELNLADQIHPNAEGHKMVAELVWDTLEPLLIP